MSKRLSVLRILLSIGDTSGPYNQFSLPMASRQNITICTYFRPEIDLPDQIKLFTGDNTLLGFFHTLKVVINAQKYDIIHAHTPHVGFFFIIACLFMHPKLLSSTVYTVHSSYPNHKFRNRLMLLWVFLFFRRIICCSHSSYASFPLLYKRLSGNRLQVIPNGTDIERIDRSIERNQTPDRFRKFTIVTVGRLIELKRPLVLLHSFHKICKSQEQLIYIGSGHLQQPLDIQSQILGIEKNVIFTGLIPREEVYQYLSNADLFVSTSSVEGLPISVLEAMACRCPVILSDIMPHREIARGADFIPLIPPEDINSFSFEIERYIRMSADERADIGQRCREVVVNNFSLNNMLDGYETVYSEIAHDQFADTRSK